MQLIVKKEATTLITNCFAILLFTQCKSQQPLPWNKSSEWKIYDVHMRDYIKLPISELGKHKNYQLDSMSILLTSSKQWPKDSVATWQNTYSTSCVIGKKTHKVIFSSHGGFFYDLLTERYYSVPQSLKAELRSYLQQSKLKLIPD